MRRPYASPIVACMVAALCIRAAAPRAVGSDDDLPPPPRRLATDDESLEPALSPRIPDAPSRPAVWPTSGPASNAVKGVLSSIRARPGEPLPGEAARLVPADGVVQAQFTDATVPGAALTQPEATSLDAALIVARVGPEVVLEADLLTPKALEWLSQLPPGMPPEKLREIRLQICKQVIDQHIEALLVYVDALREIPPDKLPEIRASVDQAFNETQLPQMMEEEGVSNSLEYERMLRERGTSLDRMRKMFFERGLAQEWLRKNTGGSHEIPHAELIAWYQNHLEEYDIPARAKFEIITVKAGLKRSRTQAWETIAGIGNEILGGRPFAEVAKSRSEGPTASSGGVYDWTTKGSLALHKIDEAIFTLPVGELSAIIEEGDALHIVRVTERQDAGRTPFLEAQVEIRQKLVEAKRKTAVDEYLAKLRARTPVWTVFDDPSGNANSPVFTAGRPATGSRQ